MSKVDDILERIGHLEKELKEELSKAEDTFRYTVRDRKVFFSAEIREYHRKLAQKWSDYVYDSGLMIVLTIPIIWLALIPAALMDAAICLYQLVCFPVYGIPRVKRSDYVIMDRHKLRYLNWIEKFNCAYCSYFNGLLAFVTEVAARTEQYWCPVRHARPLKEVHSRYRHFFDYGDAQAYRKGLAEIRKRFGDVK